MALNIVVLALVLASTFMQSGFGFYSGVLNVFCTLISVAIALGFYEPVNDLLSAQAGLPAAYSEPVSILALFLVSFAVLRTLTDNYLRRPVQVHRHVETAGSILCGFINAQLTMGIMVIALLMLPLGGTVLQFSRYVRSEDRDPTNSYKVAFERRNLWLRSDAMTVALFNAMSGGSLRGPTRFRDVYPDFLEAIYFSTNTVQPESSPTPRRDKRADGFKDGLRAESWWIVQTPIEARYRKELPTEQQRQPPYANQSFAVRPGHQLIGVRLELRPGAADKSRIATVHLFRPTQIRLVGRVGDEPRQFVPCILGGADARLEGALRIVDFDNNLERAATDEVKVDAFFEVPTDFRPEFVEYRRHARAALSAQPAESAPGQELRLAARGADGRGDASGKRTFGSVLLDSSGAHPQLPIPLGADALRRTPNVRIRDDRLAAGRLFGATSRFAPERGKPALAGFYVPEGYELVQIRYRPKEARTIVGNVFNYAARLNQYFAVDDRGERHPMTGYFAIVKRGRDQFIELFFNGGEDEPLDPAYKGMLDFKDLKADEVNQDDSEICLLFLIRGGRTILRIENQQKDGGDVRIPLP